MQASTSSIPGKVLTRAFHRVPLFGGITTFISSRRAGLVRQVKPLDWSWASELPTRSFQQVSSREHPAPVVLIYLRSSELVQHPSHLQAHAHAIRQMPSSKPSIRARLAVIAPA